MPGNKRVLKTSLTISIPTLTQYVIINLKTHTRSQHPRRGAVGLLLIACKRDGGILPTQILAVIYGAQMMRAPSRKPSESNSTWGQTISGCKNSLRLVPTHLRSGSPTDRKVRRLRHRIKNRGPGLTSVWRCEGATNKTIYNKII